MKPLIKLQNVKFDLSFLFIFFLEIYPQIVFFFFQLFIRAFICLACVFINMNVSIVGQILTGFLGGWLVSVASQVEVLVRGGSRSRQLGCRRKESWTSWESGNGGGTRQGARSGAQRGHSSTAVARACTEKIHLSINTNQIEMYLLLKKSYYIQL